MLNSARAEMAKPPEWTEEFLTSPRGFSFFSEQSAVNRFLFRDVYHFGWKLQDKGFLVGIDRKGAPFATPIDLARGCNPSMVNWLLGNGWKVGPFSLPDANKLVAEAQGGTRIVFDRNQSDYVYMRADLATLAGSSLKKARQYARQLESRTDFRAQQFQAGHCKAAIALTGSWSASRGQHRGDCVQTLEAIDLAARGVVAGRSLFLGDRLIAFLLADLAVEDVLVALVMKSALHVRGATETLLRQTALGHPNVRYVNLCQDLGIVGLRERKLRLGPSAVAHKYFIEGRSGVPR